MFRIHRRWVLSIVIAIFLMGLSTRVVQAQSTADAADRMDSEARGLFNQGKFVDAAKKFEEANRITPHPATLYNAALAWDKAGQPSLAANAYEAALRIGGLDKSRVRASTERLSSLKRQLAYLKVMRPVGGVVTIDDAEPIPIPAEVHVAPGAHVVQARASNGIEVKRDVAAKAGQVLELDMGGAAPGLAEHKNPPKSGITPDTDAGTSSRTTWGWVGVGAGAAFAGGATYFGIRTLGAIDDFEASDRWDEGARDRATQSKLITNVLVGAAIVSTGVGVYLLLTDDDTDDRVPKTRAMMRLRPTGVDAIVMF